MEWLTPELVAGTVSGLGVVGLLALAAVRIIIDEKPRRHAEKYLRDSLDDARLQIAKLRDDVAALDARYDALVIELHEAHEDARRWERRAITAGWSQGEGVTGDAT